MPGEQNRQGVASLPDVVSGLGDRTLVSAADVEIENANQLSRVYWNCLDAFFGQNCNLVLGANACTSIYLDTPNLDLLKAGLSLRDRPGGRSTCGEQYPDQFGLKYRHTEFQNAAARIVSALFPGQNLEGFLPYVRAEIERPHFHRRNVSEYRFTDLPEAIQAGIDRRLNGKGHDMVFRPQFVTFVARRKYKVHLDPAQPFQPLSQATLLNAKKHDLVCIEVALDKCVYREPPSGMTVSEIVAKSQGALSGFGRHRRDKLIMEHELKPGQSSSHLDTNAMIATYMRFRASLFDFDQPLGRVDVEPIRTAGSKAARGFKSLLTDPKNRATRPNCDGLWRLAP
jgi:hypothetical protein